MDNPKPKVSVIVISKNEESVIAQCITSILSQTYSNFELIVVDSSTDRTLDVVRRITQCQIYSTIILKVPAYGAGYARNIGIDAASGEIVTFVDADETIPNNYLEEALKIFAKKEEVLFTYVRRDLISPKTLFGKLLYAYNHLFTLIDVEFDIPRFYRKFFFDVVGRYDDKMKALEDLELIMRARTMLKEKFANVCANTPVGHNHNWEDKSNLQGHFKICVWFGQGLLFLYCRYPKAFVRRVTAILYLSLVPFLILISFLWSTFVVSLIPFACIFPYCLFKAYKKKIERKWIPLMPFLMVYKALGHAVGMGQSFLDIIIHRRESYQ